MKRIWVHAIAVAASLLGVASTAHAEFYREDVQVSCNGQANYFVWRSFSSRTLGPGHRDLDVSTAMPETPIAMAQAGFQSAPMATCYFIAGFGEGGSNVIHRITLRASQDDYHKFRMEGVRPESVTFSIDGYDLFDISSIWDDRQVDERIIEIAGNHGKYCTVKYNIGDASYASPELSGLSDFVEQDLSCRFFRLSELTETAQQEGN